MYEDEHFKYEAQVFQNTFLIVCQHILNTTNETKYSLIWIKVFIVNKAYH